MKSLLLSTLAFCVAMGTAHATETFTLSQTIDTTLNGTTTSVEQAWNFTTLPGWDAAYPVVGVVITETFSAIDGDFQSTILNGPYETNPGTSQNQDYFIFDNATSTLAPTATETATIDAPYPCCSVANPVGTENFTLADITNPTGNVLGEFDTRVARNSGSFELDTMSIELMVNTPEPSTFFLMGLGLAAAVLFARRRQQA